MSKICEYCGEKTAVLSEEVYYIADDADIVLCEKCAKKIRADINQMYYVKSEEEFLRIKARVIKKSQRFFNERITKCISDSMDERFLI